MATSSFPWSSKRLLPPSSIFTADASAIGCDAPAHREFQVRLSPEPWFSSAVDHAIPCLLEHEAQHRQLEAARTTGGPERLA